MPAENLPIQNINNSHIGFLFGSANSSVYVTGNSDEASTRTFIFGKGNGISGCSINEVGGVANVATSSFWADIFGSCNTISAGWCTINGSQNNATGHSTFITGHGNNSKGTNIFILGHGNTVTASNSWDNFILGMGNTVSGSHNHLYSCGGRVTGDNNFIHSQGGGEYVSGNNNISLTNNNPSYISGNHNFVVDCYGPVQVSGNNNIAVSNTDQSYVSGHNNVIIGSTVRVSGDHKTAIGLGLVWNGNGAPPATIVGCYNATTAVGVGAPEIFVVGNGTNTESRSDAFKIKHDGTTSAADFIASGGQKLSETIPVVLVATVAEATGHGNDGKLYIVTGAN